jgi:Fe-S-cluster-containing dehydrogenase component
MTDGTRSAEQDWENRSREILAGSESDVELGLRAAQDAQRVAAGELAEEEFRKEYHDAYLGEFGVDARPRLSEGLARRHPEEEAAIEEAIREPVAVSRRSVLRMLGGAAAGVLFLGELARRGAYGALAADGTDPASGESAASGAQNPVRLGMVIDLERCDGCLICVEACRQENGLPDGVLWPFVFAYQEPDNIDTSFLVRLCQHCSRAPCVMVCPTAARHRRPSDGLVLTDYDVCIGCRYCQVACPYGANYFQWGDPEANGGRFDDPQRDARGMSVSGNPPKGVMGKCTFCPIRQDDPERRGTAACADACPMDALHIGDLNDPDSGPRRYLARRREENGGNLSTFRLLEDLGTDPNIIYIGTPPSAQAELSEGPITYEDWGITEDRRQVLDPPAHWFRQMLGGSP